MMTCTPKLKNELNAGGFDNKTLKIEGRWHIYWGESWLDSNDLGRQVRHVYADKCACTTSRRQHLWWMWESP
jgi:hypothetical protein